MDIPRVIPPLVGAASLKVDGVACSRSLPMALCSFPGAAGKGQAETARRLFGVRLDHLAGEGERSHGDGGEAKRRARTIPVPCGNFPVSGEVRGMRSGICQSSVCW